MSKKAQDTRIKMCELGVTMLPIVNDNQDFIGMIGMKNIAKEEIFNSDKFLDSSYDNIVEALKGKVICKFDTELKGNVLVASYETNTFICRSFFNGIMCK